MLSEMITLLVNGRLPIDNMERAPGGCNNFRLSTPSRPRLAAKLHNTERFARQAPVPNATVGPRSTLKLQRRWLLYL